MVESTSARSVVLFFRTVVTDPKAYEPKYPDNFTTVDWQVSLTRFVRDQDRDAHEAIQAIRPRRNTTAIRRPRLSLCMPLDTADVLPLTYTREPR